MNSDVPEKYQGVKARGLLEIDGFKVIPRSGSMGSIGSIVFDLFHKFCSTHAHRSPSNGKCSKFRTLLNYEYLKLSPKIVFKTS